MPDNQPTMPDNPPDGRPDRAADETHESSGLAEPSAEPSAEPGGGAPGVGETVIRPPTQTGVGGTAGAETSGGAEIHGDATAVLRPGRAERWSARAGVPSATPTVRVPPVAPPPPGYPDGETGRRWWLPAVLGLLALLLLGLLGVGIWLILRAQSDPAPGPTTPPPATTPATVPQTTAPATTGAPPTTGAVLIEVPLVVGLSRAVAEDLLNQYGLPFTVTNRVSDDARPGTVIASDPAPGTRVPEGTQVTLVVAIPPPTTAPAPTTAGPASPTTGGGGG